MRQRSKKYLFADVDHCFEIHGRCCKHHIDVVSLDAFVIIAAQTVQLKYGGALPATCLEQLLSKVEDVPVAACSPVPATSQKPASAGKTIAATGTITADQAAAHIGEMAAVCSNDMALSF